MEATITTQPERDGAENSSMGRGMFENRIFGFRNEIGEYANKLTPERLAPTIEERLKTIKAIVEYEVG